MKTLVKSKLSVDNVSNSEARIQNPGDKIKKTACRG